jgi:hypothetical protein
LFQIYPLNHKKESQVLYAAFLIQLKICQLGDENFLEKSLKKHIIFWPSLAAYDNAVIISKVKFSSNNRDDLESTQQSAIVSERERDIKK